MGYDYSMATLHAPVASRVHVANDVPISTVAFGTVINVSPHVAISAPVAPAVSPESATPPVVHPGAGAPTRAPRVASVGPGSTRSAAQQAPFVPVTGRPAPAASVGAGQGRRGPVTVESITAAIAASHEKK